MCKAIAVILRPRFAGVLLAGCGAFLLVGGFIHKSNSRDKRDLPVAFWSWRNEAPGDGDVRSAVRATGAQAIFQRAGQLDLDDGRVERIRAVSGEIPSVAPLHLVYNATGDLLRGFEDIESDEIAAAIASAARTDRETAKRSGAAVVGIQLDLDVATRSLPAYAEVLRKIRSEIPPDLKLSITGLPTWMPSRDLGGVLEPLDFWIPQFYGGAIPMHIDDKIAISSPADVERWTAQANRLGKPYFAGLAAYGYAIHYAADGGLVELRGDIDPAEAARSADLELVEGTDLDGPNGDRRRIYRALRATVLDGLTIRAGEKVAVDLASVEVLHASVGAVRDNADDELLGVCLFRLPTAEDKTNLTVAEIASALSDEPTRKDIEVTIARLPTGGLRVNVANAGDLSAKRNGTFAIELEMPKGGLRGVTDVRGFGRIDTLCGNGDAATPCSAKRATLLRMQGDDGRTEQSAGATLIFGGEAPEELIGETISQDESGATRRKALILRVDERTNNDGS